ncbi:hypothetical protein BH23BAC1_BH23BAC1_22710 [soil metagenome]
MFLELIGFFGCQTNKIEFKSVLFSFIPINKVNLRGFYIGTTCAIRVGNNFGNGYLDADFLNYYFFDYSDSLYTVSIIFLT